MMNNSRLLRLFYGGPDGGQTNQAQIHLTDAAGKTLSWIVFMIRECLLILIPTPAASAKCSYLLRNEIPNNIYSVQGRWFFDTAQKPVGNDEQKNREKETMACNRYSKGKREKWKQHSG
jgi:hypothetical protein